MGIDWSSSTPDSNPSGTDTPDTARPGPEGGRRPSPDAGTERPPGRHPGRDAVPPGGAGTPRPAPGDSRPGRDQPPRPEQAAPHRRPVNPSGPTLNDIIAAMNADGTDWDQALTDWHNRRTMPQADTAQPADPATSGDAAEPREMAEACAVSEADRIQTEERGDRRGLGGGWLELPEDQRPPGVDLPLGPELIALIDEVRASDRENRFPADWTPDDIARTVLGGARAPGLTADRCGIEGPLGDDCSPDGGCWRIVDERTNPRTGAGDHAGDPILFGAHIDPTGTINRVWAARGYRADELAAQDGA